MRTRRNAAAVMLFAALPFTALSEGPRNAPEPCSAPEYKQFDFWLGAWDVSPSPGQPHAGMKEATSNENKILGGCVLIENYEEKEGFSGKSLNFYDGHLKKWRQLWTDSAGNMSEFSGEFKDGAMRFEGESHTAGGKKVFRRMILTPGPDTVRQYSEVSADGKSWKFLYDLTYDRKKRP